jgi:hypothetical protein
VFRTLLGGDGLGLSFHIHGQEFTSFSAEAAEDAAGFSIASAGDVSLDLRSDRSLEWESCFSTWK